MQGIVRLLEWNKAAWDTAESVQTYTDYTSSVKQFLGSNRNRDSNIVVYVRYEWWIIKLTRFLFYKIFYYYSFYQKIENFGSEVIYYQFHIENAANKH